MAALTTSTISRTTGVLLAGTVAALAQSATLGFWNFVRSVKNRHDAAMLAGFDDRMLADIGLTRSDIRDAYSVPIWNDPTALLNSRAGERHRYRQNAPFGLGGQTVASPSLVPDHGCAAPPTDRPARLTV